MASHIGLVVEGRGDAEALPVLLDLIQKSEGFALGNLGRPVVCNGVKNALRPGGIEGFVGAAAARPGCAGLLVVLDSDERPTCRMGPDLKARAESVTALPIVVALAENCFESWLVASAASLKLPGLTASNGKSNPVAAIQLRLADRKYSKPVWQPRLAARVDVDVAKRGSSSFGRLVERLHGLSGLA